MTDRELLEAAAKAIGINELRGAGTKHHCYYVTGEETAVKWNPLTDDGDALRLAVKLEMLVDPVNRVVAGYLSDIVVEIDSENENIYEATRRAIVRAAAEIGRV